MRRLRCAVAGTLCMLPCLGPVDFMQVASEVQTLQVFARPESRVFSTYHHHHGAQYTRLGHAGPWSTGLLCALAFFAPVSSRQMALPSWICNLISLLPRHRHCGDDS